MMWKIIRGLIVLRVEPFCPRLVPQHLGKSPDGIGAWETST